MSEEDALLRAICEHPDDDTPRLVFADWLSEQGGPLNAAWANAIRAQVWLARGATGAATSQRSKLFESSYGREKLYERLGLPQWVSQWARGFPTFASAHFHQLRDAWQRLAFRIPIRRLCLYGVSEADAAEFVAWPALTVLNELHISTVWERTAPPDVIPLLANCPALSGLKSLFLQDALFNEVTVTALMDSPHLVRLEGLVLRLFNVPTPPRLSRATQSRLFARFGPDVFVGGIPF
ncbi:TIGR02996 domain-containing protein [Frigoriglobus tundricola]|uniref:TIGR02996 domain-containing protein n=1 Tax=Frigoriglobus tundricola TaxID=2774151 RepID=A0A6M5YZ17_9BACT|nr:TIGR02996 domain-containing protein [Frigoriglobus tundricola]QJW99205.1 TIGR02996 domain-containing protein [Frigoriglobus tundricola]